MTLGCSRAGCDPIPSTAGPGWGDPVLPPRPAYPGGARPALVHQLPETNVRTYVRDPDGREGLWFFSLDAGRLEPVLVARSTYALPYMWS